MSIGIMQGRLTPSNNRGIQFFPFEEWEKEFNIANEIGLDEIEWIFDYDRYQENPLWTEEGRNKIKRLIEETNIKINSICWDYFMRRPFYKKQGNEKEVVLQENFQIFRVTLEAMKDIGAKLVEIPMVDDSSVKNETEKIEAVEFIRSLCDMAEEYKIIVGLETDFPPGGFREFLEVIGKDNLVANYDSGNSSGLGYDHEKEILSLNEKIYNVHIKDRIKGGGTVRLGTGSADLEQVFSCLNKVGYKGSFILQAARGEDGAEEQTIRDQMKFVKTYWLNVKD